MIEQVRFEANIREMRSDDGWDGDDVVVDELVDVAEMTAGDPDPFFVELVLLKEGPGGGRPKPKRYSRRAVEDTTKLAPGVQGYLGHQRPTDRDYDYRNPQMRIIKAKTAEIEHKGQKVLVSVAKAYVSRQSVDLRTHIREGRAGPVSIDGRAVLEHVNGETVVAEMRALRCVDFCNPGTEGVEGAGVQQIVSEMKTNEPEGSSEMEKPARLTRDQLMAEYGAEIREMNREAVDAALAEKVSPVEAQVAEMKGAQEEAEKALAEAKEALAAKETEVAEIAAQRDALAAEKAERELTDYRDELVAAVEYGEDVREMISKRVGVSIVDGDDDLSASKAALKEAVDREVASVSEIIKATGGSTEGRKTKTAATGNPARKEDAGAAGSDLLAAVMSPALSK